MAEWSFWSIPRRLWLVWRIQDGVLHMTAPVPACSGLCNIPIEEYSYFLHGGSGIAETMLQVAPSGNSQAFYEIVPELPACHFHDILLVKLVTKASSHSSWGEIRIQPSMEEIAKNWFGTFLDLF